MGSFTSSLTSKKIKFIIIVIIDFFLYIYIYKKLKKIRQLKLIRRRNSRILILQFLYTYYVSNINGFFLEKKLYKSILQIDDIYFLLLKTNNLLFYKLKILNKKLKFYYFFFIKNKFLSKLFRNNNLKLVHRLICNSLLRRKSFKEKEKDSKNYIYFIKNLYRNTIINKTNFNSIINNISDNWKIKNLSLIDKIILHLYICELLFFSRIPVKVIMNEYIEISKMFSTKQSKLFINGIMEKILTQLKNKILKIK
ncbi:MAG: transcription antitermination protein NusB [Candidatus Karelsulcia muelleri]